MTLVVTDGIYPSRMRRRIDLHHIELYKIRAQGITKIFN